MEKVDAYMPVFVGDYLRDTMHLSLEEHGAYLKLLFVMWGQGRGRLPNDPTRLARMVGCDRAEWDRVWPAIAEFFDIDAAFISQGRLVHELEAARSRKQKASENGRLGAQEKKRKAQPPGAAAEQATLRDGLDGTSGSLSVGLEATPQATLVATLQATLPATPPAEPQATLKQTLKRNPSSPSPSESSSPSGSPTASQPAQSGARAGDPSGTEPVLAARAMPWHSSYEWWFAFGLAWRDSHDGKTYGNGGDTKAQGELENVLLRMPEAELRGLWGQRAAMFRRYLALRDDRIVQSKHCFALFVYRFSECRPDIPTVDGGGAAPEAKDRDCEFHERGRNRGQATRKVDFKATCPECRHVLARASPRPVSEPSSMSELVTGVAQGR